MSVCACCCFRSCPFPQFSVLPLSRDCVPVFSRLSFLSRIPLLSAYALRCGRYRFLAIGCRRARLLRWPCSFTRPLARVWYLILSASASAGCTVFSIAPFVRGSGSRRVSVCLDVSCRPLSACTCRLVLVVSFVFNRAEKRRRCIHLRPSLSSVVSAGTRARVLGGCAVSFLVLLGAIHRAGHTASGLPRSFISAPVTPRGTGAPCTHVSHRIPFSNPIVLDS